MKKHNIYIVAMTALLALAGCDKNNFTRIAGEITIDARIGDMTKVSYDGASTSFTAGDKIAVYAWTGSADAVPATRTVNGIRNTLGNDGKWAPETQMLWKNASDPHFFLGVYPAKDITDFTADTFTLDPGDYTAGDLLIATNFGSGNAGLKTSDGAVKLDFDHAMAKLIVNLKFRSEYEAVPDVSAVTATAKDTATVNYLTKEITATGTSSAVVIPAAATAAAGYALSFSGLQVPQAGVKIVTLTIDGKDYAYNSSTDIPLVAGKYTTLGLVIGKNKVELASVTVDDWGLDVITAFGQAEVTGPRGTPLTIEAIEDGTKVQFMILGTSTAITLPQYRCFDGTKWTQWHGNYASGQDIVLAKAGDMVQFRGYNKTYSDPPTICKFMFDKDCYVYGNIMSLVDGNGFSTNITLTERATFMSLFMYNEHLKSHPTKPLVLPATKLKASCYAEMFRGCTGMTIAPELPATKLEDYCYEGMFSGCSNLSSLTCLATENLGAWACLRDWLKGAGTADGCERKLYVNPGMLGVGTGSDDGQWNLEDSGADGKRWTLAKYQP